MWNDGSGWYMFGHGMGMLFWLVILVLVIWFLVRLISGKGNNEEKASPQDILAERYARGEIDEDEYKKRKAVLDKES
ncbi:SHOCT domain-containing protein [Pontibacterium granulatum]|uniref:SHOCT domain-containing protein n=1 Tax=Pontibacterium granulatum TaxID=2036029 RepID=UPI00249C89C0|nr:SHOCT domain-containing protein [Pontibacterium granulatum]MDI3325827.1 SHOCT domain-containing protein [Pontibacterium granulatum]